MGGLWTHTYVPRPGAHTWGWRVGNSDSQQLASPSPSPQKYLFWGSSLAVRLVEPGNPINSGVWVWSERTARGMEAVKRELVSVIKKVGDVGLGSLETFDVVL